MRKSMGPYIGFPQPQRVASGRERGGIANSAIRPACRKARRQAMLAPKCFMRPESRNLLRQTR
jgi:hypothetical protein